MSFSFAFKSVFARNSLQTTILLCNRRFNSTYKNIIVEVRGQNKNIGFLQLHRPKAFNALNAELMVYIIFLNLLEKSFKLFNIKIG